MANEDETLKMFWDFNTANDFLTNQQVNNLMKTFPWIRFIPSIYKQRFDEIMRSKAEISKKYFYDAKVKLK